MSDVFGSIEAERPNRRRRVLIPTLLTLAALIFFGSVLVSLWTERLWFGSVGYADVFTSVLKSRALLFVLMGGAFAAFVSLNVWAAHRYRPDPIGLRRDDPAARYRFTLTPVLRPVFIVLVVVTTVLAGLVAQSRWMLFQQWWHRSSFGTGDAHFHRDIGFFVFTLPWLDYLESFLFAMIVVTAMLVLFVHYVFGGIVLSGGRGVSFTGAAQVQVALLVGLGVLVKAFGYWLDRYNLAVDTRGLFDGIGYTDAHARIPAKNILIAVAIICALLFFSTVVIRSWLLPGIGLGLLVLTSVLIGAAWPAIMQQFQVNPSEPDREGSYLQKNINATRKSYDINDVEVRSFDVRTDVSPQELSASAESRVSSRIIDPTIVSEAFEQLQQQCGYYSVPSTLDVDRYTLPGSTQSQDVVIAGRELNLAGLESSQRTWSNDHTVYTHGYGVIAARGNQRDDKGNPVWVASGIPQTGDLNITTTPRIYFGENSPEYSIVGRTKGQKAVEIDEPRCSSNDEATDDAGSSVNTYAGKGGVSIGSGLRRFVYAVKFAEPKIVLSDRVNANSKILYNRNPATMVRKVAPWLTLDGDVYPAVVDGRVVWIADGYTTSANYPNADHRSLREATSDTLTTTQQQQILPTDQVNYIRNSVKAVVDAYDGTVKLYEWDESDPLLKTWMKVFPGVVQPKSAISTDLMQHLRYPEYLYKVQRDVLAQYHVTNAQTFYANSERWKIPEDPNSDSNATQPPYYLSLARPGQKDTQFSLSSVYLPYNRQNLAAFMSVNSEATSPDFGKLQILKLPSNTPIDGPSQVAQAFQANTGVTSALLQYEQSKNTTILRGNLLTLPVVVDGADTGSLLYVQPIYVRRSQATGTSAGSYPVLQFVTVSVGNRVGIGQSLDQALDVALDLDDAPSGGDGDGGTTSPPTTGSQSADDLLKQASDYYQKAQDALKAGDLASYQEYVDKMADALAAAQKELDGATAATTAPTPAAQ